MGRIGVLLAALWFAMSPLTAAADGFACTTGVTFPEVPGVSAGTQVSVDAVHVEVGQKVVKGDPLVSFSVPTATSAPPPSSEPPIIYTRSPIEAYVTASPLSPGDPFVVQTFEIQNRHNVFIQMGSNPVMASLELAVVCPPEIMPANFALDPTPTPTPTGGGGGLVATPPGNGIAGANKDALNGATKAKAVVGGVTALVIGTVVESMTDDNNPTGTSGTVSTSGN